MDLLLLLLILAVFLLPTILMMRSQRKRQTAALEMQTSLQPGDKVVSVSGIHGTIVSGTEKTLELEIAPGVVTTMERAGIMRRLEETVTNEPGAAAEHISDSGSTRFDANPDENGRPLT